MSGYNRLNPTPGVEWWDKQPGETPSAFSRFVLYRDLTPSERSVKKVAESVRVRESTLRNQASAGRWRDRAASYDAEQARIRRSYLNEQGAKLSRAQIDLALSATGIAARTIRDLHERQVVLTPEQLTRWLPMIETMNRLAVNLPDAVTQLSATADQGETLAYFEGLSAAETERRAVEMAEGVLRLYEGGRRSA